jgi:hypothetical protein
MTVTALLLAREGFTPRRPSDSNHWMSRRPVESGHPAAAGSEQV